MRKSSKLGVGLVALAILIGLGMYFNRKHLPKAVEVAHDGVPTVAGTNRAIVHAQRPAAVAETPGETNQFGMSREKVEEYLRRHNRDVSSLLAAFHALGGTNFLQEAATNYPKDPRVQCAILAQNIFPEERRKWLDAFKASSPSNSLANYLSAGDYFKNHQPEAAIKDVLAAAGNSQFNDFSMETILDSEALGQFSGSSAMETQVSAMQAMASDSLPELASLKGVASGIREAQQQYLSSGDTTSVQNLAQAGVLLADRLMTGEGGKFVINHLVGIASETAALQALDQNASYAFLGGETPAQRLAELKQQKESIRDFTKNQNLVLTLNEEQRANYWERMKIYGELEAMHWLQQQSAATPNTGN